MASRFISAVALYGPKAGPLRDFLASMHALIAEHIGGSFRPYSLDQVHATLIALNGVRDPETSGIVNEYYLTYAGVRHVMNLGLVMDTLVTRFTSPLQIRIGGYQQHQPVPFFSRGQHPFERTFSVQGNSFVLVGWPVVARTGSARPLNKLRRDMNAANVLHRYHRHAADVDDDFYLVAGHHNGAPASALERAVDAIRDKLAADPIYLEIGISDVKIVAADSHTMAPPLFVSDIPADEAILRELMSRSVVSRSGINYGVDCAGDPGSPAATGVR